MATIKAQLYQPTAQILTVSLLTSQKILPNFTVEEIANNKAEETLKLVIGDDRAWKLLHMMQLTRYRYGSMTINSCYRTASYNKAVGGDPNSAHLKCWAFDWQKPNQTNAQRAEIAQWWRNLCIDFGEIGAINYYTHGFHCEVGSDILFGNKTFVIRDYRGKEGDW